MKADTHCISQEKKFSRLYALIGLMLIFFYMLTEIIYTLWYNVGANYGLFLTISFIALSFFLRFFDSSKEEKCLVLYALWVLATRIINGDYYLGEEFYYLVRNVLQTSCFICIGFVLDREDRRKFFDIVCTIVCSYWFILAAVGIYATLNMTRIAIFPFSMTTGLTVAYENHQMTIDNVNRNVSGVWFAIATLLMVYQFFSNKKLLSRIPVAIAAVVFYIATVLSFSRSAYVSLCVALALLIPIIFLQHFSMKNHSAKVLICVALAVLSMCLFYKSGDAARSLCSVVSSICVSEEKADVSSVGESTQTDSDSSVDKSPDEASTHDKSDSGKAVFQENRDIENFKQLGGRYYLWKSGLLTLKEDPMRLVRGGGLHTYMKRVLEFSVEISDGQYRQENSQMHNYLFDSLFLTGIPGLIIAIVFTVFLVARMVKVFFSELAPIELKLLILPLAAELVDNMMEAHILRYAIMPSILFFFISGTFLAWSYEVLPGRKKRSKING